MIRAWIEQMNFGRLLVDVRLATSLPEERAEDALLDIVSTLLHRSEEYQDTFKDQASFLAYLRKAAIRHAIQKYTRETQRVWEEEWEANHTSSATPEEQLLHALSRKNATEHLELVLASHPVAKPNVQRDLRQLVQCVLQQPEMYILARRSGQQEGLYVFHYSKLAQALGWSRKHLYKRTNQLRSLLLEHTDPNQEV